MCLHHTTASFVARPRATQAKRAEAIPLALSRERDSASVTKGGVIGFVLRHGGHRAAAGSGPTVHCAAPIPRP